MNSNHIHIKGRVQGVGMRPFIYKMACELGIDCQIANQSDGVHIWMAGDREQAEQFLKVLIENPPEQSVITGFHVNEEKVPFYSGIRIIESTQGESSDLMISPDFGICDQCKAEIKNSKNRRFNYAFATCTNCGPRYSIMNKLPYDRENTEMASFTQCDICENEFNDILDRRYYSQTNSCEDCGINMSVYESKKRINSLDQDQIIIKISDEIIAGNIVAIKGIGGFLLMCDARNSQSIKTLRLRKNRPEKPFAVMFPAMISSEILIII
jgi:hydrogenase maturation protein HypF